MCRYTFRAVNVQEIFISYWRLMHIIATLLNYHLEDKLSDFYIWQGVLIS